MLLTLKYKVLLAVPHHPILGLVIWNDPGSKILSADHPKCPIDCFPKRRNPTLKQDFKVVSTVRFPVFGYCCCTIEGSPTAWCRCLSLLKQLFSSWLQSIQIPFMAAVPSTTITSAFRLWKALRTDSAKMFPLARCDSPTHGAPAVPVVPGHFLVHRMPQNPVVHHHFPIRQRVFGVIFPIFR